MFFTQQQFWGKLPSGRNADGEGSKTFKEQGAATEPDAPLRSIGTLGDNLRSAVGVAVHTTSAGIFSTLGAVASELGERKGSEALNNAAQQAVSQAVGAAQNIPFVGDHASNFVNNLGPPQPSPEGLLVKRPLPSLKLLPTLLVLQNKNDSERQRPIRIRVC